MLERNIEKKCKKYIEKELGGRFKKLQGQGNAGDPDRLIVLPHGLTIFCELKKAGKVPTPLQERKMQQLKALGHFVFWTDSYFDFCMRVRGCVHVYKKQIGMQIRSGLE